MAAMGSVPQSEPASPVQDTLKTAMGRSNKPLHRRQGRLPQGLLPRIDLRVAKRPDLDYGNQAHQKQ